MNKLLIFLLLTVSALGGGCKQYYTGMVEVKDDSVEFKALENYNLKLALISRRQLVPGIDYDIIFKLTNIDQSPIRIPEWYAEDSSNIKLYYQLWLPGTEEPDEKAWTEFVPPIEDGAPREALDLSPGVSRIIHVVLPFMEDIKIEEGFERRFFIKAELNLNSVRVASVVYAVAVS